MTGDRRAQRRHQATTDAHATRQPAGFWHTRTAPTLPPAIHGRHLVMKVGLFLNTQFPEGTSVADRIPEMVTQVRAARDAGFKSIWFPHHWLTYPMQMLAITPMMAYIA